MREFCGQQSRHGVGLCSGSCRGLLPRLLSGKSHWVWDQSNLIVVTNPPCPSGTETVPGREPAARDGTHNDDIRIRLFAVVL